MGFYWYALLYFSLLVQLAKGTESADSTSNKQETLSSSSKEKAEKLLEKKKIEEAEEKQEISKKVLAADTAMKSAEAIRQMKRSRLLKLQLNRYTGGNAELLKRL